MSPMVSGGLWLFVYLAIVLAPVAALLVVPTPPGGGFWWDLSVGLGYAALTMMAVQFVLTARFRRATAPFGIDAIYAFHRYLAYVLLGVVILHPVILVSTNPAHLPALLTPWTVPWDVASGTASVVVLLVLVAASAWRKQLRIPYEAWRATHLLLGLGAVGLAFVHLRGVGYYTAVPLVGGLWVVIGASILAVVLKVRVFRPWSLLRAPFRVTEVRPERGACWTLVVEPEGHQGFRFEPGQFAWVTMGRSPFTMQEHPFSIASSPEPGGRLEFTIKELGDFTNNVGRTPPGEIAYVDGPYGAFSIDRQPDADGYVFIAGGIGLAPVMSMLRALAQRGDPRPLVVVAAHSSWDRVPLRDELAGLRDRLDLTLVHVLEEPSEEWEGEVGWVTKELLDRHLPPGRDRLEYYVCGPVPMIRGVERSLGTLGIPRARVHTELFDLV